MKKYLILNALAAVLTFSLSTCLDCPPEFPIEDISDLPTPFRVDSAFFLVNADVPGDGWVINFNNPVDTSSVIGKINLRTSANDPVAYTGYFFFIDPFTLFVPFCEIDGLQEGTQPPISYTLELSGDDDRPIRSTSGQRLDGDGDGTDGGIFQQKNTQNACGGNYTPTVTSPENASSNSLMVLPDTPIEMFIGFNDVRMDTSSFELGKNVFVTNDNTGSPVPVQLIWAPNWYYLRIVTLQTQAQFCTGNSCRIKVEFQKGPQSAFGKPLSDSYYFTTFVIF